MFENRRKLPLPALDGIDVQENVLPHGIYNFVRTGPDTLNYDFANRIAEILRQLIEQVTPIVDDFGNEIGEYEKGEDET